MSAPPAETSDTGATWTPSPNFGARPEGVSPDMVVLHYTAMKSCAGARDWLCNPEAGVSAHYVLGRDGTLFQLVAEADRAWHAGRGAWGAITDVNDRSIGIEIDNDGASDFAEAQLVALERLLAGVLARWSIPPERVVGHSDTAPGRKRDPGPRFPWRRLAAAGLSVWPDVPAERAAEDFLATSETVARFVAALTAFGYRGDQALILYDSFRMRFRPDGGVFDALDLAMAEDLARRFPAMPG